MGEQLNKALLGTLAALAVVPASVALACTSNGKEGIFPENNLYIPVNRFAKYATTKEEFFNAVAKMQKTYEGVLTTQGRELKIVADWEDGTVNAYATRKGNVSEVHMFGGLARHEKVTADGFMMVICHEMGHHIGGAPKKGAMWASNEGQSDYFATLKCAREIWKDEDNTAIISMMDIPQVVIERCQKAFDQPEDLAICKRAALAGKSLADTLGAMGKTGDTDFDKPDPKVVTATNNNHPAAQCRLDTYVAGAVCPKSKDDGVSETDPKPGTCAAELGEILGVRPGCWYAVEQKNPTPPRSGSKWPKVGARRPAGQ